MAALRIEAKYFGNECFILCNEWLAYLTQKEKDPGLKGDN